MSHITNLFTRSSTLGAIAVAGSGAFYVGLKYKTVMGVETPIASDSNLGSGEGQDKSYEVRAGREGGGV